jgi:hypothetical protein
MKNLVMFSMHFKFFNNLTYILFSYQQFAKYECFPFIVDFDYTNSLEV